MFWDNFYRLCNEAGKSPNKVAADLGFSTAIATKWKKGTVPKWSTIVMIAEYFGVSPETLVSEQKEKPAETEVDVDKLIEAVLKLPREKKEELLVKFMQMMKEEK